MSTEEYIANINKNISIIECILKERRLGELTRDQLEKKYNDFVTKCPKIWLAIIDNKLTLAKLHNLQQYHNVYARAYTTHPGTHEKKRLKADVNIGEIIADEFLYPSFPAAQRPTRSDKEDALVRIRKLYEPNEQTQSQQPQSQHNRVKLNLTK